MIKKIFFISLLLCILCVSRTFAQQTIIKASIDSTHMLIGQQTSIHLEVVQQKGKFVQLPILQDTITKGIELISVSKPDTSDLGSNIQIRQDYLITSFDSAIYVLPPFEAIDGGDTIYSNSLGLKISTYPVDVETKEFFDIKDVVKPPFVIWDYAMIIGIIIGIILLAFVGWFFYNVNKGKRSLNMFKKTDEPKLPPHVIAINELNRIKDQKLWQQGLNKQYYSSITDVLRKYIEERFRTRAMEMTSGEILAEIQHRNEVDPVYENLKQTLQLSDFVKFAKYQPLPDENELSIKNAYLFVDQTKKEEIPVNEENKDNKDTEQKLEQTSQSYKQ